MNIVHAIRLTDRIRLNRHRQMLQTKWIHQAELDSFEGTQDEMQRRVWERLGATLPYLQDTPHNTSARDRRKYYYLYSGLAVVATLVLVLFGQISTDDYSGIKSGPTASIPSIRDFRLGQVHSDRTVTILNQGQRIPVGSQLIFSIDTTPGESPGVVSVKYRRLPFTDAVIVDNYQLSRPSEVLRGSNGYVGFLVESPGVYEFSVNSRQNSEDNQSVSIQVGE